MANRSALARLRKELKAFDPPPYIRAAPLESNLQEWRFVLQGPHDSPYEGGLYQGKVKFPDDFPFKPPSIYMLTPNGRFETDRRLCLSISDFHPETWIPTWSVASILNGVLSFMLEDTPTTGSTVTTLAEKHRLRDASLEWNRKDATFCALFPELVDGTLFESKPTERLATAQPEERAAAMAASAASTAPEVHSDNSDPVAPAAAAVAVAVVEVPSRAPGTGKNAAQNKKKREKQKAKKAAAVAAGCGDCDREGEAERVEDDTEFAHEVSADTPGVERRLKDALRLDTQ